MLFKTKNCHQFDHPELCFSCEDSNIPSSDITWLLNFLESEVKRGVRFNANETIQIGWMLNQFQHREDGYLHIVEPDFKKMPIFFIDSLRNTLKHLRMQKDIVDSIEDNNEVSYPSILNSIVVAKNYKTADKFFLSREELEGSFSGWFFIDLEDEEQEKCELVSLYEFSCHRPDLIMFLGLPAQYGIHKHSGDEFIIVNNGEHEISLKAGSFLDLINKS